MSLHTTYVLRKSPDPPSGVSVGLRAEGHWLVQGSWALKGGVIRV